jgi:NhaP-type Na+/H+ or K+/H+ antiporter
MLEALVVLVLFIFIYSLISGRVTRMAISGPIVFIAFGLVCGPLGLGWLNLDVDEEGIKLLTELTLSFVLFTDAAGANLRVLRHRYEIPQRLLLLGLPLTILLGFVFGMGIFGELGLFEIALLATMLAPTDAALGKPVVTHPNVPADIREGLNVESGLNDGLCVPILFLFLGLALHSHSGASNWGYAIQIFSQEIGVGIVVGVGVTFGGSWLINVSKKRDWISEEWAAIPLLALILLNYILAQGWGGSGFIACFVGGLLFGRLCKHHKQQALEAGRGSGNVLALSTWVIFGANVIPQSFPSLTWRVLLYSVLSLTVIRMLPAFLVLGGMKLSAGKKAFVGWFGPRGLASVVFAIILIENNLPHAEKMVIVAVCTITLSILAHGFSANPLVNLLAKNSD